jgi:hypothetical protein
MARRASLKGLPRGWRLAALVGAVLLLHGVALEWLARQQAQAALLRPMVAPLYTRLLQPQEPPPAASSEPKRPVARAPRARAAISSVAKSNPPATATAAVEAPAPEPVPAETQVAAATPTAPAAATVTESVTPAATSTSSTGTATAALDSWPRDTRLNYRLGGRFRSGDLYGDARVQWQRDGARYQVRVDVDVTLLATLVMTSQGEVTPEGLAPQTYEEQRRGRPRGLRLGEREVVLANGNVVRRPDGVQDTASQFVELSHRFATGRERLEVGRSVSFWMARPGAVDLWTYDVVERELLKTRLGEVAAFHLKPRPIANPRGNITAEMWFAPSLQYLPVRIRVNMGDEAHLDLLVESIEQR